MKVIYKAPGTAAEPRDIPNTLEELQASVGGYIETITIASDCVIICNEEGRLLDLPFNLTFCGARLYGTILFVGRDGEEFADLSAEAMGLLMECMA